MMCTVRAKEDKASSAVEAPFQPAFTYPVSIVSEI